MKKLLNEWKKHLKEINEGDNSAKCRWRQILLKQAQAAQERGDDRAKEIQYHTEIMKELGCDMNKDYNKPESTRRRWTFSDEVKVLAEDILLSLTPFGEDAGHVEWSTELEADFLEKFEAFIEEYKEKASEAAAAAKKAAEDSREDF